MNYLKSSASAHTLRRSYKAAGSPQPVNSAAWDRILEADAAMGLDNWDYGFSAPNPATPAPAEHGTWTPTPHHSPSH